MQGATLWRGIHGNCIDSWRNQDFEPPGLTEAVLSMAKAVLTAQYTSLRVDNLSLKSWKRSKVQKHFRQMYPGLLSSASMLKFAGFDFLQFLGHNIFPDGEYFS